MKYTKIIRDFKIGDMSSIDLANFIDQNIVENFSYIYSVDKKVDLEPLYWGRTFLLNKGSFDIDKALNKQPYCTRLTISSDDELLLSEWYDYIMTVVDKFKSGYISKDADDIISKNINRISEPTGMRLNPITNGFETDLYVTTKHKQPFIQSSEGERLPLQDLIINYNGELRAWSYKIKYNDNWYDVNLIDDGHKIIV